MFYYNLAASGAAEHLKSPSSTLFNYEWRHPRASGKSLESLGCAKVREGDLVLVRPADNRCTSRWLPGKVTGVISGNNVKVDGVSRHILDVRRLFESDDEDIADVSDVEVEVSEVSNGDRLLTEDEDDDGEEDTRTGVADASPRRSVRTRRPPAWLNDYDW